MSRISQIGRWWYLAAAAISIGLHTYFLSTTPINIFPEFFVLPWFVRQGLVPYRDFFDHHGPLLTYFLSPASSPAAVAGIFSGIQSINLFLVLILLKKNSSRIGFFLGGLIYVLMTFVAGENTVWYESFILTGYLFIYALLSVSRSRRQLILLSLLLLGVSLIKPTSLIIAVPILLTMRTLKPFIIILGGWVAVLGYYALYQGLPALFDALFLFNRFYGQYHIQHPIMFLDQNLVFITLAVLVITIVTLALKNQLRNHKLLLSFVACSLFLIFPRPTGPGLAVFTGFFALLIATAIKQITGLPRYLYAALAIAFVLILGRLSYRQHRILQTRTPYQTNPAAQRIIREVRPIMTPTTSIFVYGNAVELYYFLDILPATHFPLLFPWITDYYPDIEKDMLASLSKNSDEVIIATKPLDPNFRKLAGLYEYINTQFDLWKTTQDADIYRTRERRSANQ